MDWLVGRLVDWLSGCLFGLCMCVVARWMIVRLVGLAIVCLCVWADWLRGRCVVRWFGVLVGSGVGLCVCSLVGWLDCPNVGWLVGQCSIARRMGHRAGQVVGWLLG